MKVPISTDIDLFYFMSKGKKGQQSEFTLTLKELGNRLKEMRIAKGEINYEKFAFKNDLNRAQISRYEKGGDLNFTSLLKVIKALDMNLADFFKEGFNDLK